MRRLAVVLAAVVLALVALPVQAQTVTVTDGDKIDIGGARYRLAGIDAPDLGQLCDDGYAAGQEALKSLVGLMKGRMIACDASGRDPSGRTLAICRANGRDLGEQMVRAGMAWADPKRPRVPTRPARCAGRPPRRPRPQLHAAVGVARQSALRCFPERRGSTRTSALESEESRGDFRLTFCAKYAILRT